MGKLGEAARRLWCVRIDQARIEIVKIGAYARF